MKKLVVLMVLLSGVASAGENPWDDEKITCEEIKNSTELVFATRGELGLGGYFPFDFGCPKSIAKLEFLQPLLERTRKVRFPTPGASCSGRFTQRLAWNSYEYTLTQLGYYPQGYLEGLREFPIEKQREIDSYFEEWSYRSLHNRTVYQEYQDELERSRAPLVKWYQENHQVDKSMAGKYADLALKVISHYAYANYPYNWVPEELVANTESAAEGRYERFVTDLGKASNEQKLNSLRRLLFHSPSRGIVSEIVASLPEAAIKDERRSESPLSIVINNKDLMNILLEAGFDPNHQNVFGKTPLYYAAESNLPLVAKVLLERGADVNHAYQMEEGGRRSTLNCIRIKQWQRTPLMHAAQHADIRMIKLLLEYGADPLLEDVQGSTAVDYAKENGKPENAAYLMAEIKALSQQP